ncbi:response regulator [Lacipirellula parvula]|uniref:Response regulatory domain-containing protein n=1 Tax=Lacipirellula parvula TaxID=2650471 RepID=A0A5K7XFP3_9BACT|nr:response regulator [Lacipirellula parvula]BBO35215.1 hypothetical protein PLANPX_4827 [Lacipirellula parvula]
MPSLSPPRISIVTIEDDPAQARWINRVLSNFVPEDVELTSFTDARAAHAHLSEVWTDIVVTDLDMPDVDGLELIRQAKRLNPWVQSLILTAYSTSSALVTAGDIGAADYLVKPVGEGEIEEIVQQSISRLRRWRRSLSDTLWRSRHAIPADA